MFLSWLQVPPVIDPFVGMPAAPVMPMGMPMMGTYIVDSFQNFFFRALEKCVLFFRNGWYANAHSYAHAGDGD